VRVEQSVVHIKQFNIFAGNKPEIGDGILVTVSAFQCDQNALLPSAQCHPDNKLLELNFTCSQLEPNSQFQASGN